MARSAPDWSSFRTGLIYPLRLDLGELAVRLGSPISHDRRGAVLWWDDFECGLNKWAIATRGTGASVTLASDKARNGRRSVRLTAGSDGARLAQIDHMDTFLDVTVYGVEISVLVRDQAEALELWAVADTGTVRHLSALRWEHATNRLYVRTPGPTWTLAATGLWFPRIPIGFRPLKLVVDLAAGAYVRAIVGHQEVDLRSYQPPTDTTLFPGTFLMSVRLYSRPGYNDTHYFDDAIITADEPT